MAEEFKLQQTKGKFKLVGIVNGLLSDFAYSEGVSENGKNAGKAYRRIRFGVKTSPVNNLFVEMFGAEKDTVSYYEPTTKSSVKIPFSERHNLPEGRKPNWAKSVGLTKDFNDKIIRELKVDYDAVEYIRDNLQDGDSVYVEGEFQFSTYQDKPQVRYSVSKVYLQKEPVDFEDEKFTETASFEQDIVVIDTDVDKEAKKVYLSAYTIAYGDKFNVANFVVDANTHSKLANSVSSKLKYGDWIKVYGLCLNAVELTEVEPEATVDEWGSEKPNGFDKTAIKNFINELRITGVDGSTHEKGKYKEDDFVETGVIETIGDGNPFSEEQMQVADEELPF